MIHPNELLVPFKGNLKSTTQEDSLKLETGDVQALVWGDWSNRIGGAHPYSFTPEPKEGFGGGKGHGNRTHLPSVSLVAQPFATFVWCSTSIHQTHLLLSGGQLDFPFWQHANIAFPIGEW